MPGPDGAVVTLPRWEVLGSERTAAGRVLLSPVAQCTVIHPELHEPARCHIHEDVLGSGSSWSEAQSFGLLDPKLCYLLDGILFIYGVIITALFLRAKFGRGAEVPVHQQGQNQLYNELNLGRREEYDVLDKRRARDPEMGGKQPRRKNPQEGVYNALQKDKMAEAYSEIGTKGERRRAKGHDGLYQDSHFQAVPAKEKRKRLRRAPPLVRPARGESTQQSSQSCAVSSTPHSVASWASPTAALAPWSLR
ncbi:T-cell surface glycoprotein CD3 eta chain [Heterocephalus glaber]|uniref:T-cell surface glycoprotein CD3 zeta chain n=1 Tax=Heterocephalus glaber TaxID=10181 RepID=G5AQ48_HETGA|nr:T-cell surface glycoprotein CD3 eta chain [Heterocephalus glaber]